ncbi:hypothetical protein PPYR_07163 [Photinus pyralis]|uniref:TLC domain-containing protein n=1 Tax=Photinus pyralis TaxID=7054 RepID=A0A5N4APU0_PHOPY|nr:ceramide synthase 6-like [Photinus pyralis]KAB0799283.1 hypothetical protein PPYR_07163 [Photinus pyralis]
MGAVLQTISDKFWDEDLWLPQNMTWKDLEPGFRDQVWYSNPKHLYLSVPCAFLILTLRYFAERFCLSAIGARVGIRKRKTKAFPNFLLEKTYSICQEMSYVEILGLAKQLDWTERRVERWLRVRNGQSKPSRLKKFCESSWLFCFYLSIFSFGLDAFWNKPWLWDINQCWFEYPRHNIDDEIWWFYIISTSFYLSLFISQFFDVKRKDFWQMFTHHVTTIALLTFCWVLNLHRIGILILLLHICADIFLDAAKVARYAGYQKLCDCIFAMFTVVWIVTRLCIYPFWIIRSTLTMPLTAGPPFPAYFVLNGCLIVLLMLHVFWTYLILKILANCLKAGQTGGDIRSSSSGDSED